MLAVMTIAGSDSGGGAGIEADIKALASLGIHGTAAITCITSQNTRRVASIHPLPVAQIISQIDTIMEDIHISSFKTGMLYSASVCRAVSERLRDETIGLVVDPVMVAGVGDSLAKDDLVGSMKKDLFPLATIITPNIPEAEALTMRRIQTTDDVRQACLDLSALGPEAVLIKGGHLESGTATDVIYSQGKFLEISSPRYASRGHGGGCILSSYLAGHLAKGSDVWSAALRSKADISMAILGSYVIGGGKTVVSPLEPLFIRSERYLAMEALKKAARQLCDIIPIGWVPDSGVDMAYVTRGNGGAEEYCVLDGPITIIGGRPFYSGGTSFGGRKKIASVLGEMIKKYPNVRSAASLRFTVENYHSLEMSGARIQAIGDKKAAEASENDALVKKESIWAGRFVPDVMVDRDGTGNEPMIWVFGASPEELLRKIEPLIG